MLANSSNKHESCKVVSIFPSNLLYEESKQSTNEKARLSFKNYIIEDGRETSRFSQN